MVSVFLFLVIFDSVEVKCDSFNVDFDFWQFCK